MNVTLPQAVLVHVREKGLLLDTEGAKPNRGGNVSVDLTHVDTKQLKGVAEVLEQDSYHGNSYVKLAYRGVISLIAAHEGNFDTAKVKNIDEAPGVLRAFIQKMAGKNGYILYTQRSEHWVPVFIADISVEKDYHGGKDLKILCSSYVRGEVKQDGIELPAGVVTHKTCMQILANAGLFLQNDELLQAYEDDLAAYEKLHGQVGLQVEAIGFGEYDSGGLRRSSRIDIGIGRRSAFFRNDKRVESEGKPAKMVIDIDHEGDDSEVDEPVHAVTFWSDNGKGMARHKVPIWPIINCFDLRRQAHCAINAGNLAVYKYNKAMKDSLILPEKNLKIIECLIGTDRSTYKDIVAGKGQGVTLLESGPPGTGKTLTAEVKSEELEMPLYVVQSSQLGTKAEEVEESLNIVLARAKRWNALLFIDEADTYIMERGNDLWQNAIIGVFLRLLEYFSGVLIFATNRGDKVDDAILSRCTAHVIYEMPNEKERLRIWEALAKVAEINLAKGLATKMATEWTWTSGRDIKNLLKLASMYSGKSITYDAIQAIKGFAPGIVKAEQAARAAEKAAKAA